MFHPDPLGIVTHPFLPTARSAHPGARSDRKEVKDLLQRNKRWVAGGLSTKKRSFLKKSLLKDCFLLLLLLVVVVVVVLVLLVVVVAGVVVVVLSGGL